MHKKCRPEKLKKKSLLIFFIFIIGDKIMSDGIIKMTITIELSLAFLFLKNVIINNLANKKSFITQLRAATFYFFNYVILFYITRLKAKKT